MIEMLLKLGLSEKEAKVYLAALELGSSPAAKIAEKSQVNRPTTYVILEKLCQIGLATSYEKGKIQYFTAEDPEQLQRLVDEEELILQDKLRVLKAIPHFLPYQGKSGILRVCIR